MNEANDRQPREGGTKQPDASPDYRVTVDGQPVSVCRARSCKAPWPFRCFKAGEHPDVRLASPDAPAGVAQIAPAGNAPYAFAGFTADGPTTATVTADRPLDDVRVRPADACTVRSVGGNSVTLELEGPTKLSVEPDGRHGGLLLFADAPETDVPDAGDPKVHYYGPGVHRAGVIELGSGETLYLARGAVVEGGVRAADARGIRIMGRGVLCGDPWGWRDGPQPHMIMLNRCEDVLVEGITIRCSWQWTLRLLACRNVTVRNVKICGGKNLNDDGINPCSSQDVLIEDCFIRTQDDCISIKGRCDDRRPCERITVRSCLLWSDLSRVLMVGPESHSDRIGDVRMQDCEVLYLGPPVNKAGFGDWDGCAPAFCFEAGEDCRMEDIRIENVTVSVLAERDGKDVILLEPTVNQFMKRRTPGSIRNVHFVSVAFTGEPCEPTIRMWGTDAEHTVEGIRFQGCKMFGQALTGDYPGLIVGEHAAEISCR